VNVAAAAERMPADPNRCSSRWRARWITDVSVTTPSLQIAKTPVEVWRGISTFLDPVPNGSACGVAHGDALLF